MKKFKNWKYVVALTGGIGSGKSTVLKMFETKGALVLDADRIVHKALRSDFKVQKKIFQAFGKKLADARQGVNRKALASIVFNNRSKRRKLEHILHPLVRRSMRLTLLKERGHVAVCDIPLLFETKQHRRYDVVIVVAAGERIRRQRLLAKGLKPTDIQQRFAAQWPLDKKAKQADFVINNNSSLKNIKRQVGQIWSQLT